MRPLLAKMQRSGIEEHMQTDLCIQVSVVRTINANHLHRNYHVHRKLRSYASILENQFGLSWPCNLDASCWDSLASAQYGRLQALSLDGDLPS